jgi:hypothetical protein
MLLAALADTGGKTAATQKEGGGELNPRRNGATAQHSTAEARRNSATASSAADWSARHREALAYWGAWHTAGEARLLAWGEMQSRWHRLHGRRAPAWQCAGCRRPIGGLTALDLADANRVHLDTLYCLLAFGERWRTEADTGLKALGLDPPAVPG